MAVNTGVSPPFLAEERDRIHAELHAATRAICDAKAALEQANKRWNAAAEELDGHTESRATSVLPATQAYQTVACAADAP